jgi:tetratricopeptide (TPR) repeat protein
MVPAHLPPDLASFTGRGSDLDSIIAAGTRQPGDRRTRSAVCAIDGMAGVGKTTLAVHAAHHLLPHFTDGQLVFDLHGFTEGVDPVDPGDALARLLRALGVPSQQIPHELQDRSALYRSMLYGRRMLILLDNAMDERQVAPLIPGDPGCFVLVTGRRRLTGLDDARSVSLDVLSPTDAAVLFGRAAGDQRAAREPAAVTEVVGLCGRLPLAIRIAAARLRARPTWTVAHLAERLRDRQHRLTELEAGQRSVAAALHVSYQHLTCGQKRMFRLLGLYPGLDVDARAAAALADLPLHDADQLLETLVDMHLLRPDTGQRYRLHDLIRQHARTLAEAEEPAHGRREAIGRLLDYWTYVGNVARDLAKSDPDHRTIRVTRVPQHVPRLSTAMDGTRWLTTERRNLLAGIRYAARHGLHPSTWYLARALRSLFFMRGYLDDWMATEELAIEAGRHLDDPPVMAETLESLSMIHWTIGNNAKTLEYLEQALAMLRQLADRRGEVGILVTIGMVLIRMGHAREALVRQLEALRLSIDTGHQIAEARARNMLALIYWRLGDYRAALHHAHQALAFYTGSGSRTGQADALNIAGIVHARLGQHEAAIEHAEQAVLRYGETGYYRGHSYGLNLMGAVHSELGRHGEALDHLRRAEAFARNVGDRRTEAHSLNLIGAAYRGLGDHATAIEHHQQALARCREAGDLALECEIMNETGETRLALDDAEQALDLYQQALKMADEVGDPYEQARAHQGIGVALELLGNRTAATEHVDRALRGYTELGVPAPACGVPKRRRSP